MLEVFHSLYEQSERLIFSVEKVPIMSSAPIPSVVAMLICDQIITEVGTGKRTLIGIFSNFYSLRYPARIQRVAVYVKLSDAEGDYLFKLRVVKLKDESLVAEMGVKAKIKDARQYAELALNLGSMLFVPEPGKYEFQLYEGDNYLHRVTMDAQVAQLPSGGPKQWPQQS